MIKCINDFAKMRDADLVNKALGVQAGLTNNTALPDPPVKMPIFAKATQQYSDGLVGAKSRDKIKVALKNKLRKSLVALMSQLLGYVNAAANGDKVILLSSGFTLGKETPDAYVLGDFTTVKVTHGKNSGEVKVNYAAVEGAESYLVDYAELPVQNDTYNWITKPQTYLKHLLTGLTRGKEYAIRVRAIGRGGIEISSQILTILVV